MSRERYWVRLLLKKQVEERWFDRSYYICQYCFLKNANPKFLTCPHILFFIKHPSIRWKHAINSVLNIEKEKTPIFPKKKWDFLFWYQPFSFHFPTPLPTHSTIANTSFYTVSIFQEAPLSKDSIIAIIPSFWLCVPTLLPVFLCWITALIPATNSVSSSWNWRSPTYSRDTSNWRGMNLICTH